MVESASHKLQSYLTQFPDVANLIYLNNQDKRTLELLWNLHSTSKTLHTDKTLVIVREKLAEKYSSFWTMKRRIDQIVALEDTAALKAFVYSVEGHEISCVHVRHALYKNMIKWKRISTRASKRIQEMENMHIIIMQRDNILIERDMQTYTAFPDIVLEMVRSIYSLFASYIYGNWSQQSKNVYNEVVK